MPSNKDFKRVVRARMQKTGESYTSARAQLRKKQPDVLSAQPAPAEYARLAGMSDEAVKAKTGCTWERWVGALDYVKAHAWPHRAIAEYVHEKYGVPGWWAQTVTVGYERIKGLREIGQRRGGSYEASKSKTFPVSVSKLFKAFRDRRTREKWLNGAQPTIRTSTPNRSMRITWGDGTSVQLWFTAKDRKESQVAVQHTKLQDRDAASRMKAYWEERLGALSELLSASGRS